FQSEVYEHEKYNLVKKGKLKISAKEQEKYDELFKHEPEPKPKPKFTGATQNQMLRAEISDLRKRVEKLETPVKKEEKRKPDTKEMKQKPQTK
ncbi:MAG: hypothetical protein R6U65_03570, partial [Perlabentimonas sp.]